MTYFTTVVVSIPGWLRRWSWVAGCVLACALGNLYSYRNPGPNTIAEADAFVDELHGLPRRDAGATVDHAAADAYTAGHAAPEEIPTSVLERIAFALGEPEPTPIFEVLHEEWPALLARRQRALRAPTAEIRTQFDEMTALLAVDWLCSRCESRSHVDCHGCSCACKRDDVTAVSAG